MVKVAEPSCRRRWTSIKTITRERLVIAVMGETGEPQRRIEIIPAPLPARRRRATPVPTPTPAPQPTTEPERVPAHR